MILVGIPSASGPRKEILQVQWIAPVNAAQGVHRVAQLQQRLAPLRMHRSAVGADTAGPQSHAHRFVQLIRVEQLQYTGSLSLHCQFINITRCSCQGSKVRLQTSCRCSLPQILPLHGLATCMQDLINRRHTPHFYTAPGRPGYYHIVRLRDWHEIQYSYGNQPPCQETLLNN